MRFLTAGESHGSSIIAIIDGLPAGLTINLAEINHQLQLRQGGYGRGGRMSIEKDEAQIISGIRFGETIGSPLTIKIDNRDWQNWQDEMSVMGGQTSERKITAPRPGHADLSGLLKYNRRDIRDVIERASARETAVRTAIGSIAAQLLKQLSIDVLAYVTEIANFKFSHRPKWLAVEEARRLRQESIFYSFDNNNTDLVKQFIDQLKIEGDSCGGKIEVVIEGCPSGIGSYSHWDKRLDGLLAQAIMSIPAVKGVEVGCGFALSEAKGSLVHDEIFWHNDQQYRRYTNNSGGIDGGMSNGEAITVRLAMKPIPTLMTPLRTVDIVDKSDCLANTERSDVCAVPACAIVAEAMASIVMVQAICRQFANDNIYDLIASWRNYKERICQ